MQNITNKTQKDKMTVTSEIDLAKYENIDQFLEDQKGDSYLQN